MVANKKTLTKLDCYNIFSKHNAVLLFIDARNGSVVYANESACAYYGYTAEELTSMNISQINILDKSDIEKEMALAIAEHRNYFLFRHKKANGEIRDVEVSSTPIIFDGKKLLFSIVHDITDRIIAQKKLNELNISLERAVDDKTKEAGELELRFTGVFENSGIGILLLETNGIIIDSNPALSMIVGTEKNKLKNAVFQDFFDIKEDDIFGRISELGLDFVQFEKNIKSKSGQLIPVNITVSPVKNEKIDEYYLLCLVENITYKKMIEKKQKEQEILLVQQSKMASMGEMIGAIAHQWRQPLNALGLMMQDLKAAYKFGDFSEEYLFDMVDRSMQQIHFMSKTIDSFRNFFKPSMQAEFFSIIDAINEVVMMLSAQMKNNNIKINTVFSGGAVVDVYGFKNEFKQVILNILSNSKDAILETKKPGFINITTALKEDKMSIAFEDDGGGIAEDILSKVFEPYFSTKEQGKGTGIGLYMSKIITEEHMHGKLTAKNGEKGAIFEIVLNIPKSADEVL